MCGWTNSLFHCISVFYLRILLWVCCALRRVDWHVTSLLVVVQRAQFWTVNSVDRSSLLVYINVMVFDRANMFVAANCQRYVSHRTGVVGKSPRSSETAELCQQTLRTIRLRRDWNWAHDVVTMLLNQGRVLKRFESVVVQCHVRIAWRSVCSVFSH